MRKISIIIPVYNTLPFLTDCFNSIHNQYYQDLEIIFVNDASEDESEKTLLEFAKRDTRVSVYNLEKSGGVAKARNVGMDHATGDFFYFMDSDDAIATNTLAELIEHIKEEPYIVGKISDLNMKLEETETLQKVEEKENFNKESVLNCLFKKEFIQENRLRFAEEVHYYCEYPFLMAMIKDKHTFIFHHQAYYYKRKRNAIMDNPALFQQNKGQKLNDYLLMYTLMKKTQPNDQTIHGYLDQRFKERYEKTIVPFLVRRKRIQFLFDNLNEAANVISLEHIGPMSSYFAKEMKILKKQKLEQYVKRLRYRRRMGKFKKAFKSKLNFRHQLHQSLFCRLPQTNNLIVFESFMGKSYSDNPKAIYEYIQKNELPYKCVWVYDQKRKDIPGKAKQVKRFSLRHFYYLAKAKYWVFNTRLPKRIKKRKGTTYLQTWHGTPLKKLGIDIEDVQMPGTNSNRYKKNFIAEARRWDYLISPNAYCSPIFKQAFQFENELLETGYPRNDILVKGNNSTNIERLKKTLGLPLDKKIILYAPTWRDNEYYGKGEYKFNLPLDLERMQKKLGDEYVLLFRMHYLIASQLDIEAYRGFVYDYSNHDDIADLYLVADLLITDYSSVMFDYAITKRPILFFTYDLASYRDNLRGFYFDFEKEAPGPLVETTDALLEEILNLDKTKETYKEMYDAFYERFCTWEDGQAAKKVVEQILS